MDEYETFVNPKDDPLRMTPISVKRKLQTVSCPASPTTNTLTPRNIWFDVLYLKTGSDYYGSFSITNFFENSQSSCTTNECTYTFKDSSNNIMIMSVYTGEYALDLDKIPPNLSGDWVGYVSCRTDS